MFEYFLGCREEFVYHLILLNLVFVKLYNCVYLKRTTATPQMRKFILNLFFTLRDIRYFSVVAKNLCTPEILFEPVICVILYLCICVYSYLCIFRNGPHPTNAKIHSKIHSKLTFHTLRCLNIFRSPRRIWYPQIFLNLVFVKFYNCGYFEKWLPPPHKCEITF